MNFRAIEGADVVEVRHALEQTVRSSRFTAEFHWLGMNRTGVKIITIRLREKKLYCGNHPSACELLFDAPSKRQRWLEGADWVEWNDLINDTLDELGVSANVSSIACVIRRGRCRRIWYGEDERPRGVGQNAQWDRKGSDLDYEDWIGRRAPRSEFPTGTPGVYTEIGYACVG